MPASFDTLTQTAPRIRKRWLALFLAAASPIAAGAAPAQALRPNPTPAERHRIECDYAAEEVRGFVQAQAGKPALLGDRPLGVPGPSLMPPDPLILAWRARGETNAFTACPELRGLLPANVTFATDADWEAVKKVPPDRTIFIEEIAAPFASPDGRTLLIYHSWICPGLCGGGVAARLTRRGAGWSSPEIISTWIS